MTDNERELDKLQNCIAASLSYDVYNVSTGEQTSFDRIIVVLRDLHPGLQVLDKPQARPPLGGRILKAQRLMRDVGVRLQENQASTFTHFDRSRFVKFA